MQRLDPTKVREALATIAPRAITGGWSEEVKADGHCHYFNLTGAPGTTEGTQEAISLCGNYAADVQPDELDELDPLAPENCKACRRVLLEGRKLI